MKTTSILVLALGLASLGCDDGGGEDGGVSPGTDAGPIAETDAGAPGSDAGPAPGNDAGPGGTDAGPPGGEPVHCQGTEPILADIDPLGQLMLFNPTDAPMDVSAYRLRYGAMETTVGALEALGGSSTLAPGVQTLFGWPAGFPDAIEMGELAIARPASATEIVDYVCWGDGVSGSAVRTDAEAAGVWSGPCTNMLFGGGYNLARLPDTAGTTREDYDDFAIGRVLTCP